MSISGIRWDGVPAQSPAVRPPADLDELTRYLSDVMRGIIDAPARERMRAAEILARALGLYDQSRSDGCDDGEYVTVIDDI